MGLNLPTPFGPRREPAGSRLGARAGGQHPHRSAGSASALIGTIERLRGLGQRREVSRMKLMHRSVNRQVPSSIHDRIQPVKRKTRGECKLFLPRANTDIYKNPSHLEEYKFGTACHRIL